MKSGPVFIGYHGTASTFASTLLKDGATTFTANPPYWELELPNFKGRDFDVNPLNKEDQTALWNLRKEGKLEYDRNQLGPGIVSLCFNHSIQPRISRLPRPLQKKLPRT